MVMFKKNEYLKLPAFVSALLGVWPFIFEDKPFLKKIYNIYFCCTFSYYALFILLAIIQLFIILGNEVLDVSELGANLSVTLVNSVTLLRIKAIRSWRINKLIKNIFLTEERILKGNDEKIVKIYDMHTKLNRICNIIFLINFYSVDILYIIRPLYLEDVIKYDPIKNETITVKAFPLSCWLPFSEHYVQTYLWHSFEVVFITTFLSNSDLFAFSLIIFAVGQLKILKLVLSNFQEYSLRIQAQLGSSREDASFVTIRECILKHNEIIEYINDYNIVMKNIMLIDFLQSSLQLASVLLNFLMAELTLVNLIFGGVLFVGMFVRLTMYYWYANEILVHSSEIGVALCSSNWYEEPENVQKLMVNMILRSSRDLCLEIGPFTVMTLRTFLGILKATYSYLTILYK